MRSIDKLMDSPLRNISTVIRYSGFQLLRPETVDSHTMDMAVMALIILDELPGHMDRKDLIYRIVVHDLEESTSCDIPRSLKYWSSEVHAAIEEATKAMVRCHVSQNLFNDLCSAKDLNVLEGRVIKFLDILQCCFILKKEVVYLGNKPLRKVYNEACKFLTKVIVEDGLFKNDPDEVDNYFTGLLFEFLDTKDSSTEYEE
jgi:5'-deoxynucleotidase YfbR-like HD superfamily hydrolase